KKKPKAFPDPEYCQSPGYLGKISSRRSSINPSIHSAFAYLILTLVADLVALALAQPSNATTLAGVVGALALVRTIVVWLATRGRVQTLLAYPADPESGPAAAALANARLPALSQRVGLAAALVAYGLLALSLPDLHMPFYATGIALQLSASVLHRFIVG